MRKLLASLVLLTGLLASSCAFPQPKPYDAADQVSLRLERSSFAGTRICSGWVPPDSHHAIVTDEHCIEEVGTTGWTANGRKFRVFGVLKDGNDHVILLTDLYFARTATLGPRPARGDEVFTLGNPDGIAGVLILGRVAGFVNKWTVPDWATFTDIILIDSKDYRGCSGAAVFDSQGRVIAMVNAMYAKSYAEGWYLNGAFSLKFTAKQYQQARRFQPTQEQLLQPDVLPPAPRPRGIWWR